jgi:subtilase family serine protease
MRLVPFVLIAGIASAVVSGATVRSQALAPSVRIVDQIDENRLVTLKGNTHPFANAKNDRGPVSPDLPMTDLILVLSRDPRHQAAFDRFVASQYDPSSPNFHHWLSPDQVGAEFGPSLADIGAISKWLTGHGFSLGEVTRDRMSIRFSGTAALVESTFHAEIHNLEVKGVQHIGNMNDPRIPSALTPVVVGVKSLHNFFPRPLHRLGSKVTRDSATGKWQRVADQPADSALNSTARPERVRPQFGVSVPASGNNKAYLVEDVAPYDFATIYNLLPLWNASTPIDGTGQTIAIAGTSDIVLSDVTTFRSTFGLPAYTSSNQPTVIPGNSQPLTVCTSTSSNALCGIDDLIENTLDVEWAGSVATGANITLVASYPASVSDDNLYDSESYIVTNKTANIMNVSYGLCELGNGTAGNVQYYNLWQTASSEGIAVIVAAGDGGSAECDDAGDSVGNPYSAQYGLSVNGLASTPYNTAVGGTDFNWCSLASTTECTPAPYWNSTNAANGSSAIGYVPEVPWNDTCANPLAVGYLEQWATSSYANDVGGVTDTETACNFVYNNWQEVETNTGGSSSGVNLAVFVDAVGGGGGASGCVVNDGSDVSSCVSSTTTTGTSYGSIPLVSDGWPKPSWQAGVSGIPSDGVRDIPDTAFFASDGYLSGSAYLICVSDVAACTYTAASEPFAQEVGGTSVSAPAMAGVMALINQKAGSAQGSPNVELYTLAAQQTYSSCSAESATTANGCYFNDIDTNTNALPCDYGATEGNPSTAGIVSPNCSVIHAGDLIGILPGYSAAAGYDQATGLGSLNIANVVNAWPAATTGTGTAIVTVTPAQTTLSASSALSVSVTVADSTSGGTTPTGTVTLSGGGYTSSAEALTAGAYTFTIPASSLATGSDLLTVSYSGDGNYAAATGTATVTVTSTSSSATFTISASAPAAVSAGTSATSTITVTTTNGYVGTASLTCALTTSPSGAVDLPSCSLSPSTVPLSSSATSGNVTATIATTAATTTTTQLMHPKPHGRGRGWIGAGGGTVLALLLFLGIPARRRSWRSMVGAVVVLVALGSLAGCGDFWQAPAGDTGAGTTAGTYTFTVTGSGDPQVTAVTTTFTLTVN